MGAMKVLRARPAQHRTVAAVIVAAAFLAAGACSSEAPPAPAVLTTSTAVGVGAADSCPGQSEAVVAVAPIEPGTPVADAVTSGRLVRAWYPDKYRPAATVGAEPVAGTITVPMTRATVLVGGALVPGTDPPVEITPATECWTGDDDPAIIYVVREPVTAGSMLSDLVADQRVVIGELAVNLLPQGFVIEVGSVAAVTDLPVGTIVTSATFA